MASDPRRYWSPDLRRITVEEMPAPVLNLLGKEALPVFLAEDHFNQPRTDRLYLAYWWGVAMARPLICIGQNPSRASALTKDHTITVTARRAHQLGLDGLVMLNTRSFIATQPEDLYASTRDETLEFRNHQTILKAIRAYPDAPILFAPGGDPHPQHRAACAAVEGLLRAEGRPLLCLGTTEAGLPRHPSRCGYSVVMEPWHGTFIEGAGRHAPTRRDAPSGGAEQAAQRPVGRQRPAVATGAG